MKRALTVERGNLRRCARCQAWLSVDLFGRKRTPPHIRGPRHTSYCYRCESQRQSEAQKQRRARRKADQATVTAYFVEQVRRVWRGGTTMREIGAVLGVHLKTICTWLHGTRTPWGPRVDGYLARLWAWEATR